MMAQACALALSMLGARYQAEHLRCYDGDTCTFNIILEQRQVELGFGVYHESRTVLKEQPVRLCDVDTPEMRNDKLAATRARDALVGWLAAAKRIELDVVQKNNCQTACDRHEKYGRWLVYVLADDVNLNVRLVTEGFAKPYIQCGGAAR